MVASLQYCRAYEIKPGWAIKIQETFPDNRGILILCDVKTTVVSVTQTELLKFEIVGRCNLVQPVARPKVATPKPTYNESEVTYRVPFDYQVQILKIHGQKKAPEGD
jgi:hypothetical protein